MPKKIEYPKLPVVFKEKWLTALRSGDYQQGEGEFCNNGKYCCLGVAYKEAHLRNPNKAQGFIKMGDKKLPKILRGNELDNDIVDILVAMNDNQRVDHENEYMPNRRYKRKQSFTQIANWIEKNL